MEYVTLVVIIALADYLYFMLMTGKARGKYHISAPATTGDVTFERYFRVQANALEQLIVFIPAIYLAGYYLNPVAAALIGCLFLIGRPLYYRAYISEPARRGPGMLLGFLAHVLLLLLGLACIILNLFNRVCDTLTACYILKNIHYNQ